MPGPIITTMTAAAVVVPIMVMVMVVIMIVFVLFHETHAVALVLERRVAELLPSAILAVVFISRLPANRCRGRGRRCS